MPRPTLGPAASLLRDAWRFFRRHPVFVSLLLWFLVLPNTIQDWIVRAGVLPSSPLLAFERGVRLPELFWMFLSLLLTMLGLWGWSGVLFVGRRMIQSKAGRTRSSFRSVRRDSFPFILPLLGTTVLQGCFIFYRSLLYLVPALIVALALARDASSSLDRGDTWIFFLLFPLLFPAILYTLRTFFCEIALVSEGTAYRAALRRSTELVHGRLLRTTEILLLLSILTFLPATLLWRGLDASAGLLDPRLLYASDLVGETLLSLASTLFTLACIALYGQLRDTFAPPIMVHRK